MSDTQTFPNYQDQTAGAIPVYSAVLYASLSASGSVKAAPGYFGGFSVTASTSGVIAIYDSISATGTALWSGQVNQGQIVALPNLVTAKTGIYFSLASGTATVSVFYR